MNNQEINTIINDIHIMILNGKIEQAWESYFEHEKDIKDWDDFYHLTKTLIQASSDNLFKANSQ